MAAACTAHTFASGALAPEEFDGSETYQEVDDVLERRRKSEDEVYDV